MTAWKEYPKGALLDDLIAALFVGAAGIVLLVIAGFVVDGVSLPNKSARGIVLKYDRGAYQSQVWVKTPDGIGEMYINGGGRLWDADGQAVQVIYSVGRLSHEVRPHVIMPDVF